MDCKKCGGLSVRAGFEGDKKTPTKLVGPCQDRMMYRVDCTVEDCAFKKNPQLVHNRRITQ